MSSVDDQIYEIRVAECLDDRWSDWFGELVIARSLDATCTLTGPVSDQAQLHGILARLRDIGATLISVRAVDGERQRVSGTSEQTQLPSAAHGGPTAVHAELGIDALGVGAESVD